MESLQAELRGIERCMRYCRILRERQAATQASILQTMGIASEDIYVQVQTLSKHYIGDKKLLYGWRGVLHAPHDC